MYDIDDWGQRVGQIKSILEIVHTEGEITNLFFLLSYSSKAKPEINVSAD